MDGVPAVYDERMAEDIGRIFRNEEHDYSSNLLDRSEAPDRDIPGALL